MAAGLALGAPSTAAAAGPAYDPGGLEQQLYSLTNQDRWSNGLSGLAANASLFNIARGAPHQVCGGGQTFHGRAQDMAERSYFAHAIPPCNASFADIARSSVAMQAWGENIAWNTGGGASQANTSFMNSPGHRANIMGDYNSIGVGAWPVPGTWQGHSNVVIYVVLFAKVSGATGPGGPAPPPAKPAPRPAAVAPPPPQPEVAPAPAPEPAPEDLASGAVLDAVDRHDQPIPVASAWKAPSRSGSGPLFVAGVAVRLALLAAPLGVLRLFRWRRVRLPGA